MTDPGKERVEHCLALKVGDIQFKINCQLQLSGHEIDKTNFGNFNNSAGEIFFGPPFLEETLGR